MKRILFLITAIVLVVSMAVGTAFPVFAEGMAPVAENFEIKTFRNVCVGGALSASDPDGYIVGYEITTKPVKGELRVSDGGLYVYAPNENRRGRDYFGYKAIDNEGNYSQEATVIIKIEKQKSDVAYSDMIGSADEYAAVALSEQGIFTGEKLCGRYCFDPKKTVSRAEFLAMCMTITEKPIFTSVLSTGFSDDADIQAWMKGYVATAVMCGAPIGDVETEDRAFSPDDAISVKEAAVMLDSLLGLSTVSYLEPEPEKETVQACMNLSACGILEADADTESLLERGEAARMLISAIDILKNREK